VRAEDRLKQGRQKSNGLSGAVCACAVQCKPTAENSFAKLKFQPARAEGKCALTAFRTLLVHPQLLGVVGNPGEHITALDERP